MLPLLRQALQQARELGRSSPGRYRRDVTGWLIWAALGPSGRVKTKTTAAFVPASARSADAIVTDFGRLQGAVISLVLAAHGLPIDRVKLNSPFGRGARYNLYAALALVVRHQHRHLTQAERAAVQAGAALPNGPARVAVASGRVNDEPLATR